MHDDDAFTLAFMGKIHCQTYNRSHHKFNTTNTSIRMTNLCEQAIEYALVCVCAVLMSVCLRHVLNILNADVRSSYDRSVLFFLHCEWCSFLFQWASMLFVDVIYIDFACCCRQYFIPHNIPFVPILIVNNQYVLLYWRFFLGSLELSSVVFSAECTRITSFRHFSFLYN